MTKTLDIQQLKQFTGSDLWYRHGLNRRVLFTDGAKYVADQAGAYWLLDAIALAQLSAKAVRQEAFQVWTLTVHTDRRAEEAAVLTCGDGNGKEVYRQVIAFTDFPVPEMILWFADNTIFLPSEY